MYFKYYILYLTNAVCGPILVMMKWEYNTVPADAGSDVGKLPSSVPCCHPDPRRWILGIAGLS